MRSFISPASTIADRWTATNRYASGSRVVGTALMAEADRVATKKPRVFLVGSAIGIYGNRGSDVSMSPSSVSNDDFLSGSPDE